MHARGRFWLVAAVAVMLSSTACAAVGPPSRTETTPTPVPGAADPAAVNAIPPARKAAAAASEANEKTGDIQNEIEAATGGSP